MFNCGIYKITNIINNKIYIGSAVNIKKRKYRHFWDLANNVHHSTKLQNAYNKYGKENFIHEPMIDCEEKELKYYEDYYIGYYKPFYNSSQIAIERHFLTDEQRQNISNGIKGRKHSDVTKDKMSKSALGRKLSPEHIEKVALANRGKKRTPEQISKILGIKPSEETKRKMSLNKMGNKNSKRIKCRVYDKKENKYYEGESIKELSEITNLSKDKLQRLLHDKGASKKVKERYSIEKL